MTQDSVERLLGRLITDDGFRDALKHNFDKTSFSQGFALSDAERNLIKKIDYKEFARLALKIDDSIRRGGGLEREFKFTKNS